jgi:hypothetical protein
MASGQLRVAEERLAQLRESRRVLLDGDGWEERPRKGKPETSGRPHRRKAPDEAGGR